MKKFPCIFNVVCVLTLGAPTIAWAQNTPPKIIFVSPQGADVAGAGSQSQAFRTITAAIAAHPQAGTVFQLADGTYSNATGESFPIRLPRGVVLRGNPNSNGSSVVISGGNRFVSSTFASQNVAIVAANNSRIEGITVSNSNPRGYGLWLESSRNVNITNSMFVNNTHDGIFLAGSSNAYIGNNIFTANRGSGISAVGSSTGEINSNRFESTGFGLSIGQQSQVLLVGNNIARNVDGIVVSNSAQPILRGNTITDSQRNGLVVLGSPSGSPRIDLGTTNSQGNNIFRNNRETDINNATTIPLAAFGNQIMSSRVKGLIDFNASRSPVVSNTANIPVNVSAAPLPMPVPPRTIPAPSAAPPNTVFVPARPPQQPLPSAVVAPNGGSPTVITIEREYSRPQPIAALPPVPTDPATNRPLQYRVVVPNTSTTMTQRVKTIIPSAFRLSRSGRTVLQVGAYSDRPAASQMVQKLAQSGVNAEIIPFR